MLIRKLVALALMMQFGLPLAAVAQERCSALFSKESIFRSIQADPTYVGKFAQLNLNAHQYRMRLKPYKFYRDLRTEQEVAIRLLQAELSANEFSMTSRAYEIAKDLHQVVQLYISFEGGNMDMKNAYKLEYETSNLLMKMQNVEAIDRVDTINSSQQAFEIKREGDSKLNRLARDLWKRHGVTLVYNYTKSVKERFLGAYFHEENRTLYLSDEIMRTGEIDEVVAHEILHADTHFRSRVRPGAFISGFLLNKEPSEQRALGAYTRHFSFDEIPAHGISLRIMLRALEKRADFITLQGVAAIVSRTLKLSENVEKAMAQLIKDYAANGDSLVSLDRKSVV